MFALIFPLSTSSLIIVNIIILMCNLSFPGEASISCNTSTPKPSFFLCDPEDNPPDPYGDPEWKRYSEKARQQKIKNLGSINTYSLYHLDPFNISRSIKPKEPDPKNPRPKPKSPQPQTISEERIESMVNPVDTDFRIMKWIRDCEEAQQSGMCLPHLQSVDGQTPRTAYENGFS